MTAAFSRRKRPAGDGMQQLLIEIENRLRIGAVGFQVDLGVVGIDLQPGCTGGEAGVFGIVPVIGCAGIVTAAGADPGQRLFGGCAVCHHGVIVTHSIAAVVILDGAVLHIGHADLFALIHIYIAGAGVVQNSQQLCGFLTVFLVVTVISDLAAGIVVR